MDPLTAGVAVVVALLGGGLLASFVGLRKAPVDEATAIATSASAHAGVLLADNEDLREELGEMRGTLEGLRRDWAHDREENRQLRAANEALQDENDHLRAQLREKGATP